MRVRLKGLNSIRKKLADGTRRTYWYAWKGGPPLRGEPGTPEFIHSYNVAIARKVVPPRGTLLSVAAHALRHDARKPSDVHGLPSLLVSMIGERFSGRSRADRLSSESPMRSWRDPPLTGQQAISCNARTQDAADVERDVALIALGGSGFERRTHLGRNVGTDLPFALSIAHRLET